MSPAERLAAIVGTLETLGIPCLVMGGHAVRYYGLERNTNDFDLYLAVADWDQLAVGLSQASWVPGQPLSEGPSWRRQAFRRYQIGRLPDGREEWLEFWRHNHLLPPFSELYARREVGTYGGRLLPFLALPDLIRSKETERAKDWSDVAILEEILDARNLAAATPAAGVVAALAQVRSRRGFDGHLQRGHLHQAEWVAQALAQTRLSITQAYLLPAAPATAQLPAATVPMEPIVAERLRAVPLGSLLHLALVEAVRRQYRTAAQAMDKANKEAIRAAQEEEKEGETNPRPGARDPCAES